jgi:sarcosine oxidase
VNHSFDVIVIGVGAMGAAACEALARRGQRVLGLEQFDVPHASGSHHGHSRMFRMAYYEHPDYVPLLRRALELWRELEQRGGGRLLHLTGGVYLGPADGELVPQSARAAALHGLEHELLSAAALRERYPQFNVPGDWQALIEPDAGFIVPEQAVAVMARLALEAGAEIRGREAVLQWQRKGTALEVRTARGQYIARKLVIAGGAWATRLVADLSVALVVTRQVMGWVWPPDHERFALGRFPCWAAELPDRSLHYGFPMLPWHPGLKVAHHRRGETVEPDQVDRSLHTADESQFRAALQHLRDAAGPTMSAAVCLYTNSPDSHFIVDRHPVDPDVVLACGFSGHGFKFAPVIGEILADLAIQGRTEMPAAFLGLSRFGA